MFEKKQELICMNCGGTKTKREPKGHLLLEIVLWFCYILPGLIYTIWRQTTYRQVCQMCGSDQTVPRNSRIGRKLENEFNEETLHL